MSTSAETTAPPHPARWPWLFVGLFVFLATVGSILVAVNDEPFVGQVSYIVAFFMFAIVGALIASRDRRNMIGLFLIWCAVLTGLAFASSEATTWLVIHGYVGPLTVSVGLLSGFGWALGIMPVVFFLPLFFPDGRLPSPPWRLYVWSVLSFLLLLVLSLILGQQTITGSGDVGVANPFYVQAVGDLPSLDPVVAILFPGLLALTLFSLFQRFRRSSGVERQQIKWVAFGFLSALVLIFLSEAFGSDPVLNGFIGGLGYVAFPMSIGIAVLRYRLYDLDVVVKKTVLYATLALFATAVYLGLVVGVGTWLGRGSSFLTMVAAVIVAVTFQPVRERLNRFANRVVYGRRATPYEVLTDFSERVGEAYAEVDVLPRMARVLGEGIGAERSDVWLTVGAELRQVAAWPEGAAAADPVAVSNGRPAAIPDMDRVCAVEHAGDVLGALAVRKPANDPVSPADEKLIAGLAAQAGLVLRNVRLTEELRSHLDNLKAAQRRIVTAQDEERRRLERNIHDGAQQQLVALAVKLKLADSLFNRDPSAAHDLMGDLQSETHEALEDLRDLARGIYPPLLADKGLVAALQAQARKSTLGVGFQAEDVGRFPQEVEAAVYFCVLEALQNVAKYACVTSATVTLVGTPGSLEFRVCDEGSGFDPSFSGSGSGLRGIADRMAALDGTVTLKSAPGRGTTLMGRVDVAMDAMEGVTS